MTHPLDDNRFTGFDGQLVEAVVITNRSVSVRFRSGLVMVAYPMRTDIPAQIDLELAVDWGSDPQAMERIAAKPAPAPRDPPRFRPR